MLNAGHLHTNHTQIKCQFAIPSSPNVSEQIVELAKGCMPVDYGRVSQEGAGRKEALEIRSSKIDSDAI